MSNVYLPIHVVLLFRKLVDAISAISISTQYLRLVNSGSQQQRSSDAQPDGDVQTTGIDGKRPAFSSWGAFQALKTVEWSWWTFPESWNWRRFTMLSGSLSLLSDSMTTTTTTARKASGLDATSGLNLPWFGRTWTWPSFTSILATKGASSDNAESSPRPPTSQEKRHRSRKTPRSTTRKSLEAFPPDVVHNLMNHPALYDPVRTPRYPIVLCHGLYGFDVRGPASFPSLRLHYWSNVLSVLRDTVGAEVLVTSVPATGSIATRSRTLHQQLQDKARGRGLNLLAHSMGGLDCRYLISHIRPEAYTPLSLTTVCTPHRGSPFMDWCVEHIGIGKLRAKESLIPQALSDVVPSETAPASPDAGSSQPSEPSNGPHLSSAISLASLPSSFTTFLLSIVDSPAYSNLTTTYLTRIFNPLTPNDPHVRYFSVAGRVRNMPVWHPLWLPKIVLDSVETRERARLKEEWEVGRRSNAKDNLGAEEHSDVSRVPLWDRDDEWGNDGLVTVQSARWGEFLGTLEGCDHWTMRGARGIELNVDLKPGSVLDGWTRRDWGRLVGSWRREADIAEGEAGGSTASRREQARVDEAFIKSSTDKLSAVFDWLVEQVPAPRFSSKAKEKHDGDGDSGKLEGVKKDLETRMDLERFYVALSRKLYDEGL